MHLIVLSCNSVHKWDSVVEIYTDAQTSGLKSTSAVAVNTSSLAISWLEAIFPELNDEILEEEYLLTLKARPFALFDASLRLQVHLVKCLPIIIFNCLCHKNALEL